MLRSLKLVRAEPAHPCDPIPFPGAHSVQRSGRDAQSPLRAIDRVSRRLDDLARHFNCLGHYEESDPDRPRAA